MLRTKRSRVIAAIGTISTAVVGIVAVVTMSGGTSALLGGETNGTFEATYGSHSQTAILNDDAGLPLEPQVFLVPGQSDSEKITLQNTGDVKAKFVLKYAPPASATATVGQLANTWVKVTNLDTGAVVLPQTNLPALAGPITTTGVALPTLNPSQGANLMFVVGLDESVTVGGGNAISGFKIVGTQDNS